MIKEPKLGKIALVVCLTLLIWVWADLAQDDTVSLTGVVRITVPSSAYPDKWITFRREGASESRSVAVLDSVELKGPAKKVAEVRRQNDMRKLDQDLVLYLDPNQEGLDSEGPHHLNVLRFLPRNDQMKNLGLTVESCEPSQLTVEVQNLVEKRVAVECVDASNNPLSTAEISPSSVLAWVPKDGVFTAKVRLTADDQKKATTEAVTGKPIVELAPGQPRDAMETVQVKLREELDMTVRTVRVTLGYCFSQNLQGKYQVNLLNASEFANVEIQATQAATDQFTERQAFQLILEIKDGDEVKPGTEIPGEVKFLFPPDYVQRGEIRESPNRRLPNARFTLVPVPPVSR